MAKFKAEVNIKGFKELQKEFKEINKAITSTVARKVGKQVVNEIRSQTAKGLSPILGKGRFPGYKPSYQKQIRGDLAFFTKGTGPGRKVIPIPNPTKSNPIFAAKNVRPVNLRLTGDFMNNLKFEIRKRSLGFLTNVGFSDRPSQLKEKGHREGANKQRKRPIIPQGKEQFNVTISQKIEDIYVKAIENFLSKL